MSDLSDLLSWQLAAAAARARTAKPAPTDHTHQETTMTDQSIEQEIQAKGLTAPRVTPQRIQEVQLTGQYYVFPGTTVTVCCLTLKNGFTVIGESACASPENFNEEIGRRIALKNAEEKIWALEGYLLRQRLYEAG